MALFSPLTLIVGPNEAILCLLSHFPTLQRVIKANQVFLIFHLQSGWLNPPKAKQKFPFVQGGGREAMQGVNFAIYKSISRKTRISSLKSCIFAKTRFITHHNLGKKKVDYIHDLREKLELKGFNLAWWSQFLTQVWMESLSVIWCLFECMCVVLTSYEMHESCKKMVKKANNNVSRAAHSPVG